MPDSPTGAQVSVAEAIPQFATLVASVKNEEYDYSLQGNSVSPHNIDESPAPKKRRRCANPPGTFASLHSGNCKATSEAVAGRLKVSRQPSSNSVGSGVLQANEEVVTSEVYSGQFMGLKKKGLQLKAGQESQDILPRSSSATSGLDVLSVASGQAAKHHAEPSRTPSFTGVLPAVPRQASELSPESMPGALTDNTKSPTAGGQGPNAAQLCITLTQGTDRSQGWMRANGRSTVAHLEVCGLDAEESRLMREVLLTGPRPSNPLTVSLKMELLYADTEDPVVLKMHGRFMDKLDLMQPNGSAKNSHEINVNYFEIHTSDGVSLSNRGADRTSTVHFRPWKPDEFLELRKPRIDEPTIVECSLKFSTNITSRAHSKRLFFWRATLMIGGLGPPYRDGTLRLKARTPSFEYRPRPPPAEAPTLREVLTDGKPGDMVVCIGDRIGDSHLDVRLEMQHALLDQHIVLPRTLKSKNAYVSRLPGVGSGIDLGPCLLRLANDDATTEDSFLTYGGPAPTAAVGGNIPQFNNQLQFTPLSQLSQLATEVMAIDKDAITKGNYENDSARIFEAEVCDIHPPPSIQPSAQLQLQHIAVVD